MSRSADTARWAVKRPPCGTVEAYLAHMYYGEPRDQACRDARAAYDRGYRASRDPDAKRRTKLRNRAHARAHTALARRYPAEFRALVRDELARLYAKDGLAPDGTRLAEQTISQPDRRSACDLATRGGSVEVKETSHPAGGRP